MYMMAIAVFFMINFESSSFNAVETEKPRNKYGAFHNNQALPAPNQLNPPAKIRFRIAYVSKLIVLHSTTSFNV